MIGVEVKEWLYCIRSEVVTVGDEFHTMPPMAGGSIAVR